MWRALSSLPNPPVSLVYEEVICQVCQMVMNEWRGTIGRAYTLKSQQALE